MSTANAIKATFDVIRMTPGSTARALTQKVGMALAVNVTGNALAFGLQVLLARMLGVDSFGQYIYALTVMNFCVLVAILGLDTAALRFIPEYRTQEKWGLLRGFMRHSKRAILIASVVVTVSVVSVVLLLDGHLDANLGKVILLACALLPINAYLIIQGAQLQGGKFIVAAQAPQVILRPALLGISLVLMSIFMTFQDRADVAIAINVCTSFVVALVMAKLARSLFPRELSSAEPEYQTAHWRRVSMSMMFITGFSLVLNQTDLILVGSMLSTADAGKYAAASRVAMLLTFGITLANSIAAPMMSQLYAQGKIPQLQRMLTFVAWGSFAFATPLCLGVMFWSEEILLLFGAEFTGAAGALAILAIGRWINALTGAAGYLMAMSGHEKQAAYILGVNAILNVVLNVLLIPRFGIEGAAIATLITTLSWSFLMLAYSKKYVGVNASLSIRFT